MDSVAVRSRRINYVWLSLVVVALDIITKHWAVNRLSGGRVIHVVWTLQFALGFNSGMAFSQGQGFGPYIGIFATVAVAYLFTSLAKSASRIGKVGVALVLGGALGNLVDRVFRGRGWLHGSVVDFIDLQWFPSFNVADSAITIGAVVVILSLWKQSSAVSR